jgi:HEAT repeat protein
MRRFIAIVLLVPVLAGCGREDRYPERPPTKATQPDPNDPLIGGRPLSWWVKELKSPDAETRRSAAAFIASPGEKHAVQPLIGALKDTDAPVRVAAARSLRILGKETARDALPALIAALRDPDDKVKIAAAEAVTDFRFDARAAVPALEEMYKSPSSEVRVSAGRALNHIDVEAARKAGVPPP